jgi:hypothetical protein
MYAVVTDRNTVQGAQGTGGDQHDIQTLGRQRTRTVET